MKKTLIILSALLLALNTYTFSQINVTTSICAKYIKSPFLSDGQQYKALINNGEVAEFHTTFYGGNTYRISAAIGQNEGNLIFSIYDKNRNLLYTNKDYKNSTYWDFKFTSTIDCIIETSIDDKSEKTKSGYAVLLIGFKQL